MALSKVEQADTYALRQLRELYYSMVAAEAARVILIKADAAVEKGLREKDSHKRHSFLGIPALLLSPIMHFNILQDLVYKDTHTKIMQKNEISDVLRRLCAQRRTSCRT